ncbi:MAG: hypothetical protein HUN04_06915 [Desulfobacter sp.]|nr:MAG: hypothetical protein HUN04_06915 [Desulfobacter sp.]
MSKYPKMHSAEHILNQAMVRTFGCDRCFSAHINAKKSKCDYNFDRALNAEEVALLQSEVNRIIGLDLPVIIENMDRAQAEALFSLERVPGKEELSGFRIVRMGDYDACPCVGNHVSSTGEIGTFRIISTGFDNGVLRIRFKLG